MWAPPALWQAGSPFRRERGVTPVTTGPSGRPDVPWIDFGLALAGLPVCAAALYLAGLAALSRRSASPIHRAPRLRFDVVVPAHNEENEIAQTVASLLAINYPRGLFRVFVVADNCTDRTAQRAAAAGAQVLVRNDTKHQGKGYGRAALSRALDEIRTIPGIKKVSIRYMAENPVARPFYGSFGFVEVGKDADGEVVAELAL